MALADSPAQSGQEHAMDAMTRHILKLLSDPAYDFRTIEGLAGSISPESISPDGVREILRENSDLFRLSAVPGPNGEELYTLKSNPISVREQLALAQTTVASPIG